MALKTPVVDRVPTYPGRVTLTPVSGAENTYDMVRADQPITEGTPINKALFDQKAYTLTKDVTVYVSTSGSDTGGDGTSAAPFATIQKALDTLPKWLDGHTATIDIAAGTYPGGVVIEGFRGGLIVLGIAGRSVTVNGIQINGSDTVRINISNIVQSNSVAGTLLILRNNSKAVIGGRFSVDAQNAQVSGITAEAGSHLSVLNAEVMTIVHNAGFNAVYATGGSTIALAGIAGSGSVNGLRADTGSVISYSTRSLNATTMNVTTNGGRIYTGAQTSVPNY